jgi:hypothetical protein
MAFWRFMIVPIINRKITQIIWMDVNGPFNSAYSLPVAQRKRVRASTSSAATQKWTKLKLY